MKVVKFQRKPGPDADLCVSRNTMKEIHRKIAEETELVRAGIEVFATIMQSMVTYAEDAVILASHLEDLIRQRRELFNCSINEHADDLDKAALKEYRKEMILKIAERYEIKGIHFEES